MTAVIIKSTGIWLIILFAAMVNAVIREKILSPLTGPAIALPLSGITLSALVFIITFVTITYLGGTGPGGYVVVGLFWVLLTLAFEYLFGHYVVGKPWHEINQVFNVLKGDLFAMVLIVAAVSPWLAAKLRAL